MWGRDLLHRTRLQKHKPSNQRLGDLAVSPWFFFRRTPWKKLTADKLEENRYSKAARDSYLKYVSNFCKSIKRYQRTQHNNKKRGLGIGKVTEGEARMANIHRRDAQTH